MPESFPPATLFGTHTPKLTSSIVGIEYEISVWLPPDYDSASDKTYPVLYVLDADYMFGLAAHMSWLLIIGEDIPPIIIVGIGFHIQSFEDLVIQRDRDLFPVVVEGFPGSYDDGSAKFLSFIEIELIPFMNTNYRIDPTLQNIWGNSAGGMFALYTLFHRPGLFQGVISGSPQFGLCPNVFEAMERAFAESHKALPAKVYMAMGALEGNEVKLTEALSHTLASQNYQGLTLKYEVLDNETHTSCAARLFITGLREILKM